MANPKWVDEKIAAAVRDGATALSLSNTKVTDISALANCTALRSLSLYGAKVTDISALANCTALEVYR